MKAELSAVVRKEFRQIARDRRIMALLAVGPMIQLLALGFAVNLDVDRIETVVCDLDRSPESRALLRGLFADKTFVEVGAGTDCSQPEEDVRSGRAKAAIVVPPGFERDLAGGGTSSLQLLVDGTNPIVGRFATAAADAYFTSVSTSHLLARMASVQVPLDPSAPLLILKPRILYNPALKSTVFMVPGVFAMILLVVTTIATAMGLSREREIGTMEQVLVTPIRPLELILGKVLPFAAVGCFDVLVALTVSVWVFHVPIRGSLALLGLGMILYLFSTIGTGLFISTVSRTQQQAILIGFFVIMPAILLSGFLTPIENMPDWLRPLTYVNPVRYVVEILRGVLLKGALLEDLWRSFLALGIFGPAILGLAALRFRKRVG